MCAFFPENLFHKITLEYRLKEYLITDTKAVANSIHNLSGHNADILLNNILISDGLNSFMRPTKGQFIQYENIISPSTNCFIELYVSELSSSEISFR